MIPVRELLGESSVMHTLEHLRFLIPKQELYRKLSQVVDFGCYMAAQVYFFRHHRAYIGVDCYERGEFSRLERFQTENSIRKFATVAKLRGRVIACEMCEHWDATHTANRVGVDVLIRTTSPAECKLALSAL